MNNKVKCLKRVRDEEGYQRVGRNKEGHVCMARDWQREISGEKGGFSKMGEMERDIRE